MPTNSWQATLTIKDEAGNTAFFRILFELLDEDVPADITFDNVVSALDEIVPYIDGMINGEITNMTLGRSLPLPAGIKTFPLSASDVEERGTFTFKSLYGRVTYRIPTFKDSLIVAGTNLIDITDALVAPFVFRMIDGSSTPLENTRPCDNRDDSIYALIEAYESFKRS